ncbi:MAG: ABC transporter permease [Pseudoclavibacter sp.]
MSTLDQRPETAAAEPELAPERVAPTNRISVRGLVSHATYRYGIVLAWVAVIIVFSILEPNIFFTAGNFSTIFGSQAVLLMLAIATLFSLTVGEFDMSVTGSFGMSYVLLGVLHINNGWPIAAAIAAALLCGVLIGLVNAFFIVKLGVQSIVVTLGTGTLLIGVSQAISNQVLVGVSEAFVTAIRFKLAGVSIGFWLAVLVTLVAWYIYSFTPLGRYLFFVGSGREVSRLAGINVDAIRAGALVATSTIAAGAGVVLAGTLGSVDPTVANSYLLPAFAAAFLGATAVTPGRFNPIGTFIAVYFLVTGITGLQILGFSGWIESVFYGGSLVVAVVLSRIAAMRQTSRT